MKSIISYFIKYPIAANLLMIAILIVGVVSMGRMKTTFFPQQDEKFIAIQVRWLGASPEEVEEGLVNKIEENLKGVTGVERVTSSAVENAATVTIEIAKGTDTDKALRDVKNAIDAINSFPLGAEEPTIFKVEILEFAISFALSGDVDLHTLKTYGRKVEDEFRAMEGVSKVSLSGFPEEEIEIAFREADLRAYQLTFAQATQAIRATNLELSGGTVKGAKEEVLVRAKNKKYYADELRDIVLKTSPTGGVVRLHQVADIRDKWADPNALTGISLPNSNPADALVGSSNRTYMNGEPAVVISLQTTQAEDLLGVVDKAHQYVEKFNSENDLITATVVRDESDLLRQRIDVMVENGLLGFLLVVLLLAMFLNWRLAFWVAFSIPVSLAGMFLIGGLLGMTINVVSLFGMIMVIGILVDDGIVISESIYQHYEKGAPRLQAAISGTMEVLPAVFSAIVTTWIAFSGFYFIDGRTGDFFSSVATVVIFALLFSLVEGAFILPAHVGHSAALAPNKKKNVVTKKLDDFMVWMRDKLYAPALQFSMHHKLLTLASVVGIFIITIGAFQGGVIQTTFFPNIETNTINVELKMPAGTREEITTSWLTHIEEKVWEVNEELSKKHFNNELKVIQKIQKNLGPKSHQGAVNIILLDVEARDSVTGRIIANTIREKIGVIPEAENLVFSTSAIFGKAVSISLKGEDFNELAKATEEVKNAMLQMEELRDIVDTNQEGVKEINISLKDKAKYLGLNLQEVIGQVRQGYFGSEVQRLQRGRDEVRVWVRYAESDRATLSQLEKMRVRFLDGRAFPLHEIAHLEPKKGVIAINHIDHKQEIRIDADIANDAVSVSAITTELQTQVVPAILSKYASVEAIYEGQNREQAKTGASFQKVMPLVLLLMFFAIALTFRSISQTAVVILLIPFSIIGVGWGHWFMGYPISMLSNLGALALIGILVNDALVFVTTYNQNLAKGLPQMDALYNAGTSRFRPIILTSVTTIAGLAPLMLDKSMQAQFLVPMAISVAFGLMFITVVILFLLPVLLIFVNRFKYYASWLWNAEQPTYEAMEAATPESGGYQFLWYLLFGVIVFIAVLEQIF